MIDWRPGIHAPDGLALWTGGGERIWRPLNNPKRVMASSFVDDSPRGFGLLQRDRDFEHYLDGVNYDLRPSLWVEPLGSWGRSEEHTSELQSLMRISYAVFCLKQKKSTNNTKILRIRCTSK